MTQKKLFMACIFILFIAFLAFLFAHNKNYNQGPIVFGASLPLSGINESLGKNIVTGANAYFHYVNEEGGIKGQKIEFIQYDDKYEPENTLNNTQKLIQEDKVFGLFGFVGTPTVKKVLPLIIESDIPFIAPYTGASFLRDTNIPNVINFRSSYVQEIDALVDHLVKTKGITKFAIFYQNDDYGEEGYMALNTSLKSRNLKLSAEGAYKRNTLFIEHAIQEIKSAKPEAIILVGAYKPTARFIQKMRACCLKEVIFCPISFVNADALMDELKGDGSNIVFSQTVPSYDDFSSKEVSNSYISRLKIYAPDTKPTLASFESYLAAKSLVIALKNVKGDLTRDKFIKEIKKIDRHTLEDIPLDYHNSQLLNRVYLSQYENGAFRIIDRREQ